MAPKVLALDLEGTLISNAVSCFPRPGLFAFVEFCLSNFDRVVLFTSVSEERGRQIIEALIAEGSVPSRMRDIEFVVWSGPIKDLSFISGDVHSCTLLVDDLEAYVHPDQHSQWIPIDQFAAPYPQTDRELMRVTEELRGHILR
jgi:NLI interacting factor-like phosphatase